MVYIWQHKWGILMGSMSWVGEHQYPILISHEWFPASPSQDHPEHRDQRTGSLALAKSLACHEADGSDGSGAKCDAFAETCNFSGSIKISVGHFFIWGSPGRTSRGYAEFSMRLVHPCSCFMFTCFIHAL